MQLRENQELTVNVFACEKFAQYIYDRLTIVQATREYLQEANQCNNTSPLRMLLCLMKYSVRVECLPRSKMFIADTLSLAYLLRKPTDAEMQTVSLQKTLTSRCIR